MEKAIASGMSASATVIPANKSFFGEASHVVFSFCAKRKETPSFRMILLTFHSQKSRGRCSTGSIISQFSVLQHPLVHAIICWLGDDVVEELMKQILEKLDRIESKVDRIENKLDAVYEQTARNSELESSLNDLSSTVQDHDTDIRLIKKVLTNQ